jgi:hypothetical protein
MNAPTRRGILSAIAAVPTLALPAAGAGVDSDVHAAIEAFARVKAERDAALEKLKTLLRDHCAACAEVGALGHSLRRRSASRLSGRGADAARPRGKTQVPREPAHATSAVRRAPRPPASAQRRPREL